MSVDWNPERETTLRTMWSAGLSASAIAHAMSGLTRSAVLGKAFRLGLTKRRENKIVRHAVVHKERKVRTRGGVPRKMEFEYRAEPRESMQEREVKARARREQFETVEVVDLPPEQSAVAVSLLQLTDKTCRWPLGDPRDLEAMRYCGDDPISGLPYCARHCRMAYRAPSRSNAS